MEQSFLLRERKTTNQIPFYSPPHLVQFAKKKLPACLQFFLLQKPSIRSVQQLSWSPHDSRFLLKGKLSPKLFVAIWNAKEGKGQDVGVFLQVFTKFSLFQPVMCGLFVQCIAKSFRSEKVLPTAIHEVQIAEHWGQRFSCLAKDETF